MTDKEFVWELVRQSHPEFLPEHDAADNFHAVREIVLGGSRTWQGAHQRFQPFKGARVMDVGANAGIYSAYCALQGADVIAYEPHPVVFKLLSDMARNTGLWPRLVALNMAIWKFDGEIPFLSHISPVEEGFIRYNGGLESEGIHFTGKERMDGARAKCRSFDLALELPGSERWDCVKMDIEGAEFEVLLAASPEALERIDFMYLELHPWVSDETYIKTIAKLEDVFKFEGAWRADSGRWEAVYLCRKH